MEKVRVLATSTFYPFLYICVIVSICYEKGPAVRYRCIIASCISMPYCRRGQIYFYSSVFCTFVGNGHVCCLILYGHEGCKVRYIYLLLSLMHFFDMFVV